jgi:hypothetical protein
VAIHGNTPTAEITVFPTVPEKGTPEVSQADQPIVETVITTTAGLTFREPSVSQLNQYLRSFNAPFVPFDENAIFDREDVSGDQIPDLVRKGVPFSEVGGDALLAIIYQDVNGDNVTDLVMYGAEGVLILIWKEDHYAEPFIISTWESRGFPPDNHATFADWTEDGIPEIVFDHKTAGGGSGLWVVYTERNVIHCDGQGCKTVWTSDIEVDTDDYNFGGLARYRLDVQPYTTKNGTPFLRSRDEGFQIHCCDAGTEKDVYDGLEVYTSTQRVYDWDGYQFVLSDESIITRGYKIAEQSNLMDINKKGDQALITYRYNMTLGNMNDYCQAFVNNFTIGGRFGCRGNFTTVEWKDITGDGQDELLIIAYSAGYPLDDQQNLLGDEICMHQHLIAYEWLNRNAREIANVTGCVQEKDLFGIRLESNDSGAWEIIAAWNGKLNKRIYKWDGQHYVMWGELP